MVLCYETAMFLFPVDCSLKFQRTTCQQKSSSYHFDWVAADCQKKYSFFLWPSFPVIFNSWKYLWELGNKKLIVCVRALAPWWKGARRWPQHGPCSTCTAPHSTWCMGEQGPINPAATGLVDSPVKQCEARLQVRSRLNPGNPNNSLKTGQRQAHLWLRSDIPMWS